MIGTRETMPKPFTFHFAWDDPPGEDAGAATVPELVSEGETLVSATGEGGATTMLTAGSHCRLLADGSALVAETTGYPFATAHQKKGVWTVAVEILPLLEIDRQGMLACLNLYPPCGNHPPLSLEELNHLIAAEGVRYGLDQTVLTEVLATVAARRQPLTAQPIARGILPMAGRNAHLRFELEVAPLPGRLLRDGSIDFHERNIFIGVDQGELIATRVAATAGTPGMDIFGRAISQKSGEDIALKLAGDIDFDPESGRITAARSGVLTVVNDCELTVSAILTIAGDIDFTVGNIESRDALLIRGSVLPGFTVRSGGNLQVDGTIQGATVITGGNARVKGGLLGKKTHLNCQGDADVEFLERAELLTGGSAVIRKGVYYGSVYAACAITLGPTSRLVGGICCCAGNFVGGHVGTAKASTAIIAAGVDRKRYGRHQRLQRQVAELAERLTAKRIRHGRKITNEPRYQQEMAELEQLSTDLDRLNLLPGSALFSRGEPGGTTVSASIAIQGTVFAGTELRIGNLSRLLDEDLSGVRFSLDREGRRILNHPLP